MMKGIQLKEEMSTWLWDLPNYFKIKEIRTMKKN